MTNFLNLQTNILENLAPGEAEESYLKGTHGISNSEPAFVVDPRDSMTYKIAPDRAPEYIKAGFRFEQPEEKTNRAFREDVQANPVTSALKTFAYQAVNQASLDALSTGVEALSPEKTAQRDILQEEHPFVNFLGGATGLGVSAAYGGPVWKGVDFAGELGAQLVKKGVSVFGKEAAESLAGRAAQAVARSSLQGAAMAVPSAVTESILGPHEGVAEAVMAGAHRIEEGAEIGAAFTPFAAALKFAGKQLSPASLDEASRELQLKGFGGFRTPEIKKLDEVVAPEIRAARAAAAPGDTGQFIKPSSATVNEEVGKLFDQQGYSRDLKNIFKTPQDLSDDLKKAMVDIGEKMNVTRETADALVPGAVTTGDLFTKKIPALISKYNNTEGQTLTNSAKNVGDITNAIREEFAAAGAASGGGLRMGFDQAYQLQQRLKKIVFPDGGFGQDAALSPGAYDVYNTLTQHIDGYLTSVIKNNPNSFKTTIGELKSAYSQAQRLSSVVEPAANRIAANNKIGLTDYLSGGVGGLVGQGAGAAMGVVANKTARVYGRQLTSSLLWKASQAIDRTQNFVNNTIGQAMAGRIAKNITPASIGVLNQLASNGPEPIKDRAEAYDKFTTKLQEFSNPEHAAEVLSDVTSGLQKEMPGTSQAMQQSLAAGVAYLQQNLPTRPDIPGAFDNKKWTPSDRDIASFERKVTAVNDPLSIMTDLQTGILSKDSVDAVATVYPVLFQHIQQKVMEYAGQYPNMPYGVKMKMSLILGQPLRAMNHTTKIRGLQKMFESTAKPQPRANSKITEAGRMGTDTNRAISGQ